MSRTVEAATGEGGGGNGENIRRRQPGSKRSTSTATDGRRMTVKGKKKRKVTSRSKDISVKRRSVVTGAVGLPIDWNKEDCDFYEDSQDETYEPSHPRELYRSIPR